MADEIQGIRDGLKLIMNDQFDTLRSILDGLDDDAVNWVPGPETNSIAVLYTHLLGAENSMTATVASESFERDRDAEFRVKEGVASLTKLVNDTEGRVMPRIDKLSLEALAINHAPAGDRLGRNHLGSWWIFHAVEHSREHIGQALLTRQLYEQRG
ncbi:MAG TPA: DUF664 domain-containing protein [Nitrolancea sp.]|nr:DUF664 domain-containing protein [Nitrolancea sp.]